MLSELRRPTPSPTVLDWFDATRPTELYPSVMVIGEIRQGVERLHPRDPARSAHHEAWLHQLQESFVDRILEITMPIAEAWGKASRARASAGRGRFSSLRPPSFTVDGRHP